MPELPADPSLYGTYGNAEFSRDVIERFPELRDDLEFDADLLHPQMGTLAAAVLHAIEKGDALLPQKICAFLDEALGKPYAIAEIENAVAISFVEPLQLRKSSAGRLLLRTMPDRVRKIIIEQEDRGGAQ